MSFISKLGLSIVALLLLICPVRTATQDEQLIPFETVVKYVTNGPREKLQMVVFKNRAWKQLWNRAHSGFAAVPPRPEVDFSQRMIIAVSVEYLPDPSWSIAISKVVTTENGLKIFIRETHRAGRFCPPTPTILVYPLQVIEAERVDKNLMKNAQFEIEQQLVDCEPPK